MSEIKWSGKKSTKDFKDSTYVQMPQFNFITPHFFAIYMNFISLLSELLYSLKWNAEMKFSAN